MDDELILTVSSTDQDVSLPGDGVLGTSDRTVNSKPRLRSVVVHPVSNKISWADLAPETNTAADTSDSDQSDDGGDDDDDDDDDDNGGGEEKKFACKNDGGDVDSGICGNGQIAEAAEGDDGASSSSSSTKTRGLLKSCSIEESDRRLERKVFQRETAWPQMPNSPRSTSSTTSRSKPRSGRRGGARRRRVQINKRTNDAERTTAQVERTQMPRTHIGAAMGWFLGTRNNESASSYFVSRLQERECCPKADCRRLRAYCGRVLTLLHHLGRHADALAAEDFSLEQEALWLKKNGSEPYSGYCYGTPATMNNPRKTNEYERDFVERVGHVGFMERHSSGNTNPGRIPLPLEYAYHYPHHPEFLRYPEEVVFPAVNGQQLQY